MVETLTCRPLIDSSGAFSGQGAMDKFLTAANFNPCAALPLHPGRSAVKVAEGKMNGTSFGGSLTF